MSLEMPTTVAGLAMSQTDSSKTTARDQKAKKINGRPEQLLLLLPGDRKHVTWHDARRSFPSLLERTTPVDHTFICRGRPLAHRVFFPQVPRESKGG